jgi:hypothetical protein
MKYNILMQILIRNLIIVLLIISKYKPGSIKRVYYALIIRNTHVNNDRLGVIWDFSVRFEVFTAVTLQNAVFWDVTPCGSCKNRRFGGT